MASNYITPFMIIRVHSLEYVFPKSGGGFVVTPPHFDATANGQGTP